MRRLRLLGLVVAIALAAAVPAHAIFKPKTVSGQMDSQPGNEKVKAVEIPDPSDPSDHDLSQVAVDVLKSCPSGPTEQRIAGPKEALVALRLVKADTRPGEEAFVDMRSGASGRFGELRIVSLRRGPAGSPNCEMPHNDFLYKSTRPTRHPRGASTLTDFELTIRNFSRRYHGLELRLLEGWAKPTDALCCPSLEKRTFYRYDRKRDRYLRYASKVSHTRRH